MTEDELRRAYGALREHERRTAPHPDAPPPTPDALWAALQGDLEPGERVRILDNALRAGQGNELALVQTMHSAAQAASQAGSSTAPNAGAPAAPRRAPASGGAARRWWPLAAAAVLFAAVGVPLWRDSAGTPDGAGTGGARYREAVPLATPQLVVPDAEMPLAPGDRFVWRPVTGAQRYQLEVMDAAGTTVTSFTTTDTTVTLPDTISETTRQRIAAWWVTATMPDGSTRRSELRVVAPSAQP